MNTTHHSDGSKTHSGEVSLRQAYIELRASLPDEANGRIEVLLITGKKYWVTEVIEEWTDAVKLITEPAGLPVLVMRQAIVSVTPEPGRTGAGP